MHGYENKSKANLCRFVRVGPTRTKPYRLALDCGVHFFMPSCLKFVNTHLEMLRHLRRFVHKISRTCTVKDVIDYIRNAQFRANVEYNRDFFLI